MSERIHLDINKILRVLPHRFPFVMVDRIHRVVPKESIDGHKCVAFNEPWFQGHYPGCPIMPGVLIVEALVQIGTVLAYVSDPFDAEKNIMYFIGLEKVKFRHPVMPGDRLDLHAEIVHHRSNIWKLHGEATVDGTLCAQGDLLASIVDREP